MTFQEWAIDLLGPVGAAVTLAALRDMCWAIESAVLVDMLRGED